MSESSAEKVVVMVLVVVVARFLIAIAAAAAQLLLALRPIVRQAAVATLHQQLRHCPAHARDGA